MASYLDILPQITTFIFDIDGVLSDGSVLLMPDGEQLRTMCTKDGYAIQLAKKKGYNVAIISGGRSESVRSRFTHLGIHDVYLGSNDKIDTLDEYCLTYDIKPENILYMGDDIPDYGVMKTVGLPTCPADAAKEIVEISSFISSKDGGTGAVREAIEMVMRAQGNWFDTGMNETKLKEFGW
jgi:3-deoxy-D-manno-octulosonate 8-phosphate phosphatase (KDO 8-P phosphatase)